MNDEERGWLGRCVAAALVGAGSAWAVMMGGLWVLSKLAMVPW